MRGFPNQSVQCCYTVYILISTYNYILNLMLSSQNNSFVTFFKACYLSKSTLSPILVLESNRCVVATWKEKYIARIDVYIETRCVKKTITCVYAVISGFIT